MTMGIEAQLRQELERANHRRRAVLRVLPYLLLVVSLVFTVLHAFQETGIDVPTVAVLTLAAAIWIYVFHTRHPHWHRNPALMGVYVGVLVVLAGGLVAQSAWFGFFAFICYLHADAYLRGRWKYVGLTAAAAVTAAAFLGGSEGLVGWQAWLAWLAVTVLVALIAGASMRLGELEEERTQRQRQSLDELHAANAQLEEALRDNAALHAQLLVQAREAGVQDERQRMAREIHDTLAQSLAGILAQLQAAEQTLAPGSPERRQVTSAVALSREGLTEARRTVHDVEPQVLAEARLPEAIQATVARWSRDSGIEAAVTTTGRSRPLHPEVEVTLLRGAQESLANAAKHARADRVALTLSYLEDEVTLDVVDDGVGFDPAAVQAPGAAHGRAPGAAHGHGPGAARDQAPPEGGFGLAGMRQRVQRLAGRVEIESEPGGGTAISMTVPAIPAREDAS